MKTALNQRTILYRLLCFIAILTLDTDTGVAQTNNSILAARDWGPPASGIQLSIALTNSTLLVGSVVNVSAHIKNGWTNFIYVVVADPASDYSVFLTSKLGKLIRLTPDARGNPNWHRFAEKVEPGKEYKSSISITIDKLVAPGHYTMKTVRSVLIPNMTDENKNKLCDVESNTVEVQVQ